MAWAQIFNKDREQAKLRGFDKAQDEHETNARIEEVEYPSSDLPLENRLGSIYQRKAAEIEETQLQVVYEAGQCAVVKRGQDADGFPSLLGLKPFHDEGDNEMQEYDRSCKWQREAQRLLFKQTEEEIMLEKRTGQPSLPTADCS